MAELLTANDLIYKTSPEVKTWLENVLSGKVKVHPEFNWLGFASVTGSNACESARKNEKISSLEWAEISLKIYEKLTNSAVESDLSSCELLAMYIRVSMINNFGNLPADYLLSSDIIITWFNERLELSLEEAIKYSKEFIKSSHDERIIEHTANASQLLKIRRIKNRLGVIDELKKGGKVNLNDEIEKWLHARKHLV